MKERKCGCVLTFFRFMKMTKVRPSNEPTLKNWTLPFSFWGVWLALTLCGDDGTRASMWYANSD
jgi:hypothetical protein